MEKLYYNLSEEEFTKGRKVLLWVFAGLFFLAGVYVLIISLVFHHESIPAILSLAPFGISLLVTIIAFFATITRKDLYFSIDDEKIEFRYGIFLPEKRSFYWRDIKELKMPQKDAKMMLILNTGNPYVIDMSYLKRKKSLLIKKQLYFAARENKLNVHKVSTLA